MLVCQQQISRLADKVLTRLGVWSDEDLLQESLRARLAGISPRASPLSPARIPRAAERGARAQLAQVTSAEDPRGDPGKGQWEMQPSRPPGSSAQPPAQPGAPQLPVHLRDQFCPHQRCSPGRLTGILASEEAAGLGKQNTTPPAQAEQEGARKTFLLRIPPSLNQCFNPMEHSGLSQVAPRPTPPAMVFKFSRLGIPRKRLPSPSLLHCNIPCYEWLFHSPILFFFSVTQTITRSCVIS